MKAKNPKVTKTFSTSKASEPSPEPWLATDVILPPRLRLVRYDEGPPGGWKYKEPKTGTWIGSNTWKSLLVMVAAHLRSYDIPVPNDIAEQVEHQLASNLPPEWRK